MDREKLQIRVLVLSLLVQTLLLLNSTFTLAATLGLYQCSMVEGLDGEELKVEVNLGTDRPQNLLSWLGQMADNWGLDWLMEWSVGGQESSTVTTSLTITVTGSNVQSTATVDYYLKAVSSSDPAKWVKVLEGSGVSVTVGGSLQNSTGATPIDDHLASMGLSTTQDQTVDYYVWVKVTSTGLVSGEELVVEIPETLFDTIAFDYQNIQVFKRYACTGVGYQGYVRTPGDLCKPNQDDDPVYFGLDSYDYNYSAWFAFQDVAVPQGATINWACLNFKPVLGDALGVGTVTIVGYDEDYFRNSYLDTFEEYFTRPRTSARVIWTVPSFYEDHKYNTTDISPIVQEIVDRSDWNTEDWMVFFVQGRTSIGQARKVYACMYMAQASHYLTELILFYEAFQASWYPTTISLAEIPLTLNLVALVALMAATVVALRDNQEKYCGAVAAFTAILAVAILGHGGVAASWGAMPPLSVTLSHLFGLEETPRWFTVGALSVVAVATFEALRRKVN